MKNLYKVEEGEVTSADWETEVDWDSSIIVKASTEELALEAAQLYDDGRIGYDNMIFNGCLLKAIDKKDEYPSFIVRDIYYRHSYPDVKFFDTLEEAEQCRDDWVEGFAKNLETHEDQLLYDIKYLNKSFNPSYLEADNIMKEALKKATLAVAQATIVIGKPSDLCGDEI